MKINGLLRGLKEKGIIPRTRFLPLNLVRTDTIALMHAGDMLDIDVFFTLQFDQPLHEAGSTVLAQFRLDPVGHFKNKMARSFLDGF